MRRALGNSLTIAAATMVLATVFGTASALAMAAASGRVRSLLEQLTYVAIIVPGIVIGIAALLFLVSIFGSINPWLAYLLPADPPRSSGWAPTASSRRTRCSRWPSSTCWSGPACGAWIARWSRRPRICTRRPWRTFWQVTLPQLLPAVIAGALLSFTFSFDDFIVAFFMSGQDQTLPIFLFASIRRGVTPEANAIATALLAVTLGSMLIAGWYIRRSRPGAR